MQRNPVFRMHKAPFVFPVKPFCAVLLLFYSVLPMAAQTPLAVTDKQAWTGTQLSAYVGQQVRLTDDWYITDNYNG